TVVEATDLHTAELLGGVHGTGDLGAGQDAFLAVPDAGDLERAGLAFQEVVESGKLEPLELGAEVGESAEFDAGHALGIGPAGGELDGHALVGRVAAAVAVHERELQPGDPPGDHSLAKTELKADDGIDL